MDGSRKDLSGFKKKGGSKKNVDGSEESSQSSQQNVEDKSSQQTTNTRASVSVKFSDTHFIPEKLENKYKKTWSEEHLGSNHALDVSNDPDDDDQPKLPKSQHRVNIAERINMDNSQPQENVNISQQNMDNPQQNVNISQQNMDNAEQNVNISEQNMDDSQQNMEASEQNMETSAYQNTDVSQMSMDDAQQNMDDAQQTMDDAQQSMDAFEQNMDAFQQNMEASEINIEASAHQNTDFSYMSMDDAQENMGDAQENMGDAQENMDDAQQNMDDAQQNMDDAQQNMGDAQESMDDAQQNIDDAQQNMDDAQQTMDDAQQNMDDAQQTMDDAQQSMKTKNLKILPEDPDPYEGYEINPEYGWIDGSEQKVNELQKLMNGSEQNMDASQFVDGIQQNLSAFPQNTETSQQNTELSEEDMDAYLQKVNASQQNLDNLFQGSGPFEEYQSTADFGLLDGLQEESMDRSQQIVGESKQTVDGSLQIVGASKQVVDGSKQLLDETQQIMTGFMETSQKSMYGPPQIMDSSQQSMDVENSMQFSETSPQNFFETADAENIFSEIKVARQENLDDVRTHTLNSFIISKTFSSENVVVLLNLRREKDGEWVLDKTIAQGLRPQTYGGVVSIDQYDTFNSQPPPEVSSARPPQKDAEVAPVMTETESLHPSVSSKNIMDALKRLEDYVAGLNREFEVAREILKNKPRSSNPSDPKDSSNCSNSSKPNNLSTSTSCKITNNDDGVCDAEHLDFDDLPFAEKLFKMFKELLADEVDLCCNLPTSSAQPSQSKSKNTNEPKFDPLDDF